MPSVQFIRHLDDPFRPPRTKFLINLDDVANLADARDAVFRIFGPLILARAVFVAGSKTLMGVRTTRWRMNAFGFRVYLPIEGACRE